MFTSFKNVQICRHFGPPFAPVFPSFWMSYDVDKGTRDLRLNLSRLFYLCKSNSIVHTTCWKGAFCMDHEAKTSEVSQAWSRTFLNLRHNSEHVDAVISRTGRPQENRIFRFLNIHNKIVFHPNRKFFSQMFIAWNVGSHGKITILMIWALKCLLGRNWMLFNVIKLTLSLLISSLVFCPFLFCRKSSRKHRKVILYFKAAASSRPHLGTFSLHCLIRTDILDKERKTRMKITSLHRLHACLYSKILSFYLEIVEK